MNPPIIALASLLSLALFAVLFFWLYRDYAVDDFRQRMFELRDRLFDEAAKGNISFNSPAYGMLRSTMNGNIRFAHRLNFFFVVIVLVLSRHEQIEYTPFSKRLEAGLKRHDAATKEMMRSYFQEMNFLVLRHIVIGSPLVLVTLFLPLWFAIETKRHLHKVAVKLRKPLDRLDSVALDIGEVQSP